MRVTDNLGLKAGEYVISLKGVEVARFEIAAGLRNGDQPGRRAVESIEGIRTKSRRSAFRPCGFRTAGPKRRAGRATRWSTRSACSGRIWRRSLRITRTSCSRGRTAKRVLDRVAEENPKAWWKIWFRNCSPLAVVQKVLQNLLRERVSIRDAVTILEALGEAAQVTRNPVLLTELVRQAIRRMVVQPYLNPAGDLPAFCWSSLDHAVEAAVEHGEHASHLNLPPQRIRDILDRMAKVVGSTETPVVVLTGSGSRYFVRQIAESALRNVIVISHSEIPPGVKVDVARPGSVRNGRDAPACTGAQMDRRRPPAMAAINFVLRRTFPCG